MPYWPAKDFKGLVTPSNWPKRSYSDNG